MHTESSGGIAAPGACGCRWGMGGAAALQAASPQEMEEQDMTDTSFHGALLWPLPAELQGGSNNRYFTDTEFTGFQRCQLVSLAVGRLIQTDSVLGVSAPDVLAALQAKPACKMLRERTGRGNTAT